MNEDKIITIVIHMYLLLLPWLIYMDLHNFSHIKNSKACRLFFPKANIKHSKAFAFVELKQLLSFTCFSHVACAHWRCELLKFKVIHFAGIRH